MLTWWGLTDFGDSAAMLPAAALIAAWLVAGRAWRRAAFWAGGFAVLSLLVTISKLAFMGWGIGSEAIDFTGISGHTALAVSILSVGADACLADFGRRARLCAAVSGAAIGVAIGLSRLALHVHSVSEVVAGTLLGGTVAAIYFWGTAHANPAKLRPAVLGGILVLILGMTHGHRAPTQNLLTRVALSLSGRSEPYSRTDWQTGVTGQDGHPSQLAERPPNSSVLIGN